MRVRSLDALGAEREARLNLDRALHVTQRRALLADLAIVARQVVEGDGAHDGVSLRQHLGLLEHLERQRRVVLLHARHGEEVAHLADALAGVVDLDRVEPEAVAAQHQRALHSLQRLHQLAVALQLLAQLVDLAQRRQLAPHLFVVRRAGALLLARDGHCARLRLRVVEGAGAGAAPRLCKLRAGLH